MAEDWKLMPDLHGKPLTVPQVDVLLASAWRAKSPWERQAFLDNGGVIAMHPFVMEECEVAGSSGYPRSPWRCTFDRRLRLTWRGVLEVPADTSLRYDEVMLRRDEALTFQTYPEAERGYDLGPPSHR